jgi:hypothetical protein
MKWLFSAIAVFMVINCFAQATPPPNPCKDPAVSQFDFWVGNWELTWADSLHGTNHVERIMDGCTVQENFNDPQMKFSGKSWSVYSVPRKQWQQTWVDNNGGYIVLFGGMQGDSMVLSTPMRETPKGKITSRMVYYNIKKDSFDWSWEASMDGGMTWKVNWLIHYKRRS